MSITKAEGSARDRLLAAANELFYEEGVHTVGIDRVIERAGVAKASLYSTFGSKEELVRAYLEERGSTRRGRIERRLERFEDPRDRVLAVFDLLGEIAAEPSFRGCAFVNASAEGPRGENKVRQVCRDMRAWTRSLFEGLARELGVSDPERFGRRLALLYDGAVVGASMETDPSLAAEARAMAEGMLDAELASARKPRAAGSRRSARR
jgi:AcrR family transcriptional regulator